MSAWLKKHREVLAYLLFGVLTTLLNILLYALFSELFGYKAANSWGNVLDNILCILFAYATNRAFVFASKTHGRDAWREFGAFVTCRLGTLVLDAVCKQDPRPGCLAGVWRICHLPSGYTGAGRCHHAGRGQPAGGSGRCPGGAGSLAHLSPAAWVHWCWTLSSCW